MPRTSQAKALRERRDAPRADVDGRYSMRLDPCDGREPIACLLLNFSIIGVRLELPEDVPLPSKVRILVADLAHSARIAWRNGTIVGIDLIDEHHSIY